jgi:hypothetical protein
MKVLVWHLSVEKHIKLVIGEISEGVDDGSETPESDIS